MKSADDLITIWVVFSLFIIGAFTAILAIEFVEARVWLTFIVIVYFTMGLLVIKYGDWE